MKALRYTYEELLALLLILAWLLGAVLASGFWSTLFAIFFPPWGWYLIVERVARAWGWL